MPMQYRSTNPIGYTHHNGAFIAGVEQESGIELNPTSSANAPRILPCGDESNKGIMLASKGTGTITIGSSANQPVVFTSTGVTMTGASIAAANLTLSTGAVLQVGSTAPFAGMIRQRSSLATPNFNSTGYFGITSTITMVGVNSSHFILVNPENLSTAVHITRAFAGSTAGSVNLTWTKISTVTIGASTATVRLLAFRF